MFAVLIGGVLRNSVVINRTTYAGAYIAAVSGSSAYNCTFVATGTTLTNGIIAQYGSGTLRNCYVGGVSAPKTGNTSFTVTTCHTNATASGWTTTVYSTATFENITDATRDFRLASGSGLIDVGTTDSTYAVSDVSGLSRSGTWDIGADSSEQQREFGHLATSLDIPVGHRLDMPVGHRLDIHRRSNLATGYK